VDRKNTKSYKLGRNIFKLRKLKSLTQEQLAEKAGFTRNYLARVETGRKNISLQLLFKIAEILDVPEKELFDFK